ncbi:hypothetical protein [Novosphingobium sp.]|uniref:hypothetical protein n=1 Tax=Novosphingobium sp. TaxID=1874826 RepID=UPI002B49CC14|nr:hypothetical protein [Novosphingobium sp.]HKR93257.1 hypothetical protein [Novosphingobium sp.]
MAMSCASRVRGYGGIDNHGGYMLIDPNTRFAVSGTRYDLTGADVAEVIAYLTTP